MPRGDSFSKLLARHNGDGTAPGAAPGHARLFDDAAMARIIDASLGVVAALRSLAEVTEDVLRERRDRLLERGGADPPAAADGHENDDGEAREHIPLTY
jgi:hypothetical protein